MLKGDLRKKQIMETAERLFCENGYEKTSVQDILDELHLSKGSFYHHFEGKELLLRGMCERRAEAAAVRLREEDPLGDGVAELHRVFSAMIPFNGEGLQFLTVLLPVFALPEGRSIRESYQLALREAFRPEALEAMGWAVAAGQVWCDDPATTVNICLDLVNDLWAEVSARMIQAEAEQHGLEDLGEVLTITEAYRRALENMLTAPCGSMALLDLSALRELAAQIHRHWERPASA